MTPPVGAGAGSVEQATATEAAGVPSELQAPPSPSVGAHVGPPLLLLLPLPLPLLLPLLPLPLPLLELLPVPLELPLPLLPPLLPLALEP